MKESVNRRINPSGEASPPDEGFRADENKKSDQGCLLPGAETRHQPKHFHWKRAGEFADARQIFRFILLLPGTEAPEGSRNVRLQNCGEALQTRRLDDHELDFDEWLIVEKRGARWMSDNSFRLLEMPLAPS